MKDKLNTTEATILHALITCTTENIADGKRIEKAKESLIQKGYLRVNEHHLIELNLSENYLTNRGYPNNNMQQQTKGK